MSGAQSERYEDHRVAQAALDIAIRTLNRSFPCVRKTDVPRSQCIFAAMDTQGKRCDEIDPAALCDPCKATWYSQQASILLHCVEQDDVDQIERIYAIDDGTA